VLCTGRALDLPGIALSPAGSFYGIDVCMSHTAEHGIFADTGQCLELMGVLDGVCSSNQRYASIFPVNDVGSEKIISRKSMAFS
jgi:hypothetical protein